VRRKRGSVLHVAARS